MSAPIVVIGAGMGGLAAALRLARAGFDVEVLEARTDPGGLAASQQLRGLRFDAGPYILLDRPGLEWAFAQLGLDLGPLDLRRVEDVYEVQAGAGPPVRILADLDATAAGIDRLESGAGVRYARLVREMARLRQKLEPMLRVSRPGPLDLLRTGALVAAPFLLRSLGDVLRAARLPAPVIDALGVWTHVAGQSLFEAPSPMAFVPALIHTAGAWLPAGGVGEVPALIAREAEAAGVRFRWGARVARIRVERGAAVGVETAAGDFVPAGAVLSDASGIGTQLDLVEGTPAREATRLRKLPLQSPGVSAYLAARGDPAGPYLRFRLQGGTDGCQLLVQPAAVVPALRRDGVHPARLLAPLGHQRAERDGEPGQRAFLVALLAEPWWKSCAGPYEVLATRIPAEWGAQYHLYRESMNPVMTARFMRKGRLPHKSPHVRGLYFAGSSTHPGQWVSFCAISGVMAADALRRDLS